MPRASMRPSVSGECGTNASIKNVIKVGVHTHALAPGCERGGGW
jgi:hypothetical protein